MVESFAGYSQSLLGHPLVNFRLSDVPEFSLRNRGELIFATVIFFLFFTRTDLLDLKEKGLLASNSDYLT